MQVWKYSDLGHVQLVDGYIEVVYDKYTERPQRQKSGQIVFLKPNLFPQPLRHLALRAFDELWRKNKPAKNDSLLKTHKFKKPKNPLEFLFKR